MEGEITALFIYFIYLCTAVITIYILPEYNKIRISLLHYMNISSVHCYNYVRTKLSYTLNICM